MYVVLQYSALLIKFYTLHVKNGEHSLYKMFFCPCAVVYHTLKVIHTQLLKILRLFIGMIQTEK
jgi:hypothetical protein